MFRYFLLRVALVISKYVNAVLKALVGYSFFSGNVLDLEQSKSYRGKCVHRLKIHCRASMFDIGGFDHKSFFLSHQSYQPIDYLKKDEVSLAFLDQRYAYFVETLPGCNIYDTTNHPFLYGAQFKLTANIIRVTLKNFLEFAQELGDPKANVISLYSTGRCGSTLLTQMMEGVPNTIVMSEPMFQTNLLEDNNGQLITTGTTYNMQQIIRAGYRVQCKPLNNRQVDNFVLKSVSLVIKTAAKTQEACPYIRNVFMHRAPKPNIQSFRAMMGSMPWFGKFIASRTFFNSLARLYPDDCDKVPVIRDLEDKWLRKIGSAEMIALFFGLHVLNFREYSTKKKISFFSISYEDLLASPEGTMKKLLAHCSMSTRTLDQCISAMSKDSQQGSAISREKLQKSRPKDFTEGEIRNVNEIFQKMDLPPLERFHEAFEQ